MKTILLALTTLLVFYHTSLTASKPSVTNDKTIMNKSEARPGLTSETILLLAPATPSEATFDDADSSPVNDNRNVILKKMAPVTPREASFEDQVTSTLRGFFHLFPSTPKEATFEDFPTK